LKTFEIGKISRFCNKSVTIPEILRWAYTGRSLENIIKSPSAQVLFSNWVIHFFVKVSERKTSWNIFQKSWAPIHVLHENCRTTPKENRKFSLACALLRSLKETRE